MIEYFCASNGFKLDALNEGYQLRIEDSFDFYPTNGRWHFLPTGERGDWHTEADLKVTILALLNRPRIEFNPSRFSGGLDFSPESIIRDDARVFSKNMAMDRQGRIHPVSIPADDVYCLSHPTTTTKLSLWQRIKRLFR